MKFKPSGRRRRIARHNEEDPNAVQPSACRTSQPPNNVARLGQLESFSSD